jgi:hypothetical protein
LLLNPGWQVLTPPLIPEELGEGLVGLAEVAGEDVQFGAVFGDGAASDLDAAGDELLDQFLVGEGFGTVLIGDELVEDGLHRGVGHGIAGGGLEAGGEEVFHVEHPLWGEHVLAGDGAADGGFVDADDFGDLDHGHGAEMGDAMFHEVALALHDFLGDAGDGVLALVDALDEEFPGADFFPDVFANLGRGFGLAEEILVGVADPEVGDVVGVGGDDEFVTIAGDGDLGDDEGIVIRGDGEAGAWIEEGDVFGGFLGFTGGDAEVTGDFGEPTFAEGFEVVLEDAVFEGLCLVGTFELEHEALAQIAGADAGRVEGLDDLEDGLDLVRGDAGGEGEFVAAGLEVAPVIDVADDHFGDLALGGIELGEPDLFEEFLLEGGLGDEGIEHELPTFLLVGIRTAAGTAGGKVIAPFLVELEDLLEFVVEGLVGFARRLLGGGIEPEFWGRFGGIGGGGGLFTPGFALLGGDFGDGGFLEDGVLLEFLFDESLEFKDRGLQQREGLLQLGRQNHLLRHALREMESLRHCGVDSTEAAGRYKAGVGIDFALTADCQGKRSRSPRRLVGFRRVLHPTVSIRVRVPHETLGRSWVVVAGFPHASRKASMQRRGVDPLDPAGRCAVGCGVGERGGGWSRGRGALGIPPDSKEGSSVGGAGVGIHRPFHCQSVGE